MRMPVRHYVNSVSRLDDGASAPRYSSLRSEKVITAFAITMASATW